MTDMDSFQNIGIFIKEKDKAVDPGLWYWCNGVTTITPYFYRDDMSNFVTQNILYTRDDSGTTRTYTAEALPFFNIKAKIYADDATSDKTIAYSFDQSGYQEWLDDSAYTYEKQSGVSVAAAAAIPVLGADKKYHGEFEPVKIDDHFLAPMSYSDITIYMRFGDDGRPVRAIKYYNIANTQAFFIPQNGVTVPSDFPTSVLDELKMTYETETENNKTTITDCLAFNPPIDETKTVYSYPIRIRCERLDIETEQIPRGIVSDFKFKIPDINNMIWLSDISDIEGSSFHFLSDKIKDAKGNDTRLPLNLTSREHARRLAGVSDWTNEHSDKSQWTVEQRESYDKLLDVRRIPTQKFSDLERFSFTIYTSDGKEYYRRAWDNVTESFGTDSDELLIENVFLEIEPDYYYVVEARTHTGAEFNSGKKIVRSPLAYDFVKEYGGGFELNTAGVNFETYKIITSFSLSADDIEKLNNKPSYMKFNIRDLILKNKTLWTLGSDPDNGRAVIGISISDGTTETSVFTFRLTQDKLNTTVTKQIIFSFEDNKEYSLIIAVSAEAGEAEYGEKVPQTIRGIDMFCSSIMTENRTASGSELKVVDLRRDKANCYTSDKSNGGFQDCILSTVTKTGDSSSSSITLETSEDDTFNSECVEFVMYPGGGVNWLDYPLPRKIPVTINNLTVSNTNIGESCEIPINFSVIGIYDSEQDDNYPSNNISVPYYERMSATTYSRGGTKLITVDGGGNYSGSLELEAIGFGDENLRELVKDIETGAPAPNRVVFRIQLGTRNGGNSVAARRKSGGITSLKITLPKIDGYIPSSGESATWSWTSWNPVALDSNNTKKYTSRAKTYFSCDYVSPKVDLNDNMRYFYFPAEDAYRLTEQPQECMTDDSVMMRITPTENAPSPSKVTYREVYPADSEITYYDLIGMTYEQVRDGKENGEDIHIRRYGDSKLGIPAYIGLGITFGNSRLINDPFAISGIDYSYTVYYRKSDEYKSSDKTGAVLVWVPSHRTSVIKLAPNEDFIRGDYKIDKLDLPTLNVNYITSSVSVMGVGSENNQKYISIISPDTTIQKNKETAIVTTIGSKMPYIISNGEADYYTGSSSGVFVPYRCEDCDFDYTEARKYKNELNDFLSTSVPKLLKSYEGYGYIIGVSLASEQSKEHRNLIHTSFEWTQIGDLRDMGDINEYRIGEDNIFNRNYLYKA